jgi:putative hydrolase of the HAD superfamily
VLDAVLFDWGDTLYHFAYDESLLEAGWGAGLATLGSKALPAADLVAARFREHYLPRIFAPGTIEEIEYPDLVRELLGEFDVAVSDDELVRFLLAEHAIWDPVRVMGAHTHALLDSLRDRGLKLGLVSNAFDPGWLLREDLARMGLAERLDVAVFSSEVGMRKPHPSIFKAALDPLGVAAERTLFVGDRRYEDVRGPRQLGMKTVLALWFRVDLDDERGEDPDFEAFTPMDILNIATRLREESPST